MEIGRSRTAPISQSQKKMLTDFMRDHPQLLKGSFSSTFTHQKAQELWEELTDSLNSIPGGALKDWKKWRKTWQDLKKMTKTKMVSKRKDLGMTGGGPPADIKIDDNIADLIDPTEVDGHIDVPEPKIIFDWADINLPKKIVPTPDPLPESPKPILKANEKPSIKPSIEELIIEVEGDGEKEEMGNQGNVKENDHLYNMEYPPGLPRKKINQTQRLQTSIKLSQQLLKGVNCRNDVMENYYTKKMAFMDHQMEHNKKMLKAVEKNSEALNNLLAAIVSKK